MVTISAFWLPHQSGWGFDCVAALSDSPCYHVHYFTPCRCGVLQPGDRILAINGRYTEEMTSDEASNLLRESGQQCVLDVEFDIAGNSACFYQSTFAALCNEQLTVSFL